MDCSSGNGYGVRHKEQDENSVAMVHITVLPGGSREYLRYIRSARLSGSKPIGTAWTNRCSLSYWHRIVERDIATRWNSAIFARRLFVGHCRDYVSACDTLGVDQPLN